MHHIPTMGLGTFIGIEHQPINDPQERHHVTVNTILTALMIGYRHLDLAENYGNLRAINEALQSAFKSTNEGGLGLKRSELWLTMKANGPFDQPHIDSLLKQVGVTYFDLFLVHHPDSTFQNEGVLARNWSLLCQQRDTLHRIGVSNCYIPHLSRLIALCERDNLPLPYANEIEVNILSKKQALVRYCQEHKIEVIAYSPLGYNMATIIPSVPEMTQIAKELSATPHQVALAWCMAKGIAVIPVSKNHDRLKQNWDAQIQVQSLKEKESRRRLIAIDQAGDLIPFVTTTAETMSQHGDSLTWQVTPKKAEDDHSTQMRL